MFKTKWLWIWLISLNSLVLIDSNLIKNLTSSNVLFLEITFIVFSFLFFRLDEYFKIDSKLEKLIKTYKKRVK